ncbi:hypothetical protein [Parahaliea mediterranea]|uniref:General secretion pathway protein GspK n=1 Tax=Parahaliea mediterranea TaxID=651086 RepID=A0A939IKP4_9GAMM|nr:hypothetical protein [Parahaliea mediterranea]MBN7795167.1 hypothetical protein [Parahaliea mediterranea]
MEYDTGTIRLSDKQSGVALAIVLWFLAAMSLLVAGIVHQGRVDVRLAQAHVARAEAIASGDGAIHLMLARFTAAPLEGGGRRGELPLSGVFDLGNTQVWVKMVPASGLVDVFGSPPQLLAALFAQRGGLSPADAQQLADSVVELRSPLARRQQLGMQRAVRFSTPEDLLRVPGFNRALLDAIQDDIRAVPGGRDNLNWSAASQGLLQAVSSTNPRRAAYLADRRSEAAGARLWNVQVEELFRVDAVIQYGDQYWMRRRWIRLEQGRGSQLPWYAVRSEAPRAVPQIMNSGVE